MAYTVVECVHPFAVGKIPPGWILHEQSSRHELWLRPSKTLSVIVSIERHDEKLWQHCSIAHPKRMPSYDELTFMRRHWMGAEIPAIMVFPAREHHVNTHKFCLHLYACLEPGGSGLPEFSTMVPGLGRQI